MTSNNLCDSCSNYGCEFQSGIIRTKCAFYMPPLIESDNCGNYVVMQPTVNVLDKIRAEIEPKCDRINNLASILPYTAHREIQELLCEIMDLCKAESEDKE